MQASEAKRRKVVVEPKAIRKSPHHHGSERKARIHVGSEPSKDHQSLASRPDDEEDVRVSRREPTRSSNHAAKHPHAKNSRKEDRCSATSVLSEEGEWDTNDEEVGLYSDEEEEEEDDCDSSDDGESDPDFKLDLRGEAVTSFEGSRRDEPLGRLGKKLSTGSYGWVYEFAPDPARKVDVAGGGKPMPLVAKICHLPFGFFPSHVLRELQLLRLLNGHPCAPALASGVWMGEVSVRAVERARRKYLTQEERRLVKDDDEKSPDDRYLAILMEHAGSTLQDLCLDAGNERARFEILAKTLPGVLSALCCLHTLGIAHRDVKLNNVLVRDGGKGTPCLIDFGLGKRLLRRNSDRVGVLGYRTPENARWDNEIYDLSVDGHALACCFLIGMQPKGEDDNVTDDDRRLRECVRRSRKTFESYPGGARWWQAISEMVAPEPSQRPKLDAVWDALGDAVPDEEVDRHRSALDSFHDRASRLLLVGPDACALTPERCSAARWVEIVCSKAELPSIVFTRSMELLDSVKRKLIPASLAGKQALSRWKRVGLACVVLVATYFLSDDNYWDVLSFEFNVPVAALRAAHVEVASAAGWVVLKAGSFSDRSAFLAAAGSSSTTKKTRQATREEPFPSKSYWTPALLEARREVAERNLIPL